MKINIAHIRQAIGARQSFSFRCPVEEITGADPGLWLHGPVEVEGEVVNNGRLLLVSGTVRVASRQTCHRCLADFGRAENIAFTENFQESDSADADPEVSTFTGDELDIGEVVREALVMAEPLKALCREDCLGICQQCGVNRNLEPCSCQTASIDPRLAALEKLLERK